MLSREDFYMIKQMRQQGAYIVDIATQIGCSERTVRRYLKYPEPPARKTRHKMVKLKPFMDYIDMRLAENVWNSEVIFAEIKAMGYTGGRSMLRYYIQPKRKMRPSKRTVRFETQPGYQLQHDWGEVEVEVAGPRCKVNFAVNTLGFSRRFHVFAAPKQDAEHTYESLVRAFRYFGGCVKTMLVDNQKSAVLKNNNGKVVFIDRNLNPQKTKKAPQNGCFFNTPCAPYERKRLLNRMTLIDTGYEWRFFAPFPVKWTQLPLCGSQPHTCCRASRSCIRTSSASR